MKNYSIFYKKGGFKYSTQTVDVHLSMVNSFSPLQGKVLDAPSGLGEWTYGLERRGCEVTSSDICPEGLGITWDLEQYNPSWEGKFDLVFSRGISHLHRRDIPTSYEKVVKNLSRYAPRILIIYYTNQTNEGPNSHFNPTKKSLDDLHQLYLPSWNLRSTVKNHYYIGELTQCTLV